MVASASPSSGPCTSISPERTTPASLSALQTQAPLSSLSGPSTPHEPGCRPLLITPPPSGRGTASKTSSSSVTTSSYRSHREYMDSLHPPSEQEFRRLAALQEEREREHRRRDHELYRQNLAAARKSMEARRDFMQTRALDDEQESRRRRSSFRRRLSESMSRSRSRANSKDMPGPGSEANQDRERIQSKAALVIQRSYRGYRVRREMQGLGIDASTRWTHAIRDAQWRELTTPRARADSLLPGSGNGYADGDQRPSTSRSAARQNWMKVATIARRAGGDEDSDHLSASSTSSLPDDDEMESMSPEQKEAVRKKRAKAQEKRRKHARIMGLQYFLEMVDLKHRYGSNLRMYHEEWKKADTNENFFYWLDYGEGRDIDLVACPRERLMREQVRYLSPEERQYYLVKVDWEGRLVWAKNGMHVDTTEQWKDSIHGIVPIDDPTPAFSPEVERHLQAKPSISAPPRPHDLHHSVPTSPSSSSSSSSSSSTSTSSRESELEAAMAAKYANPGFDNAHGLRKIRHMSAATIFDKLLRKSVRRNTWIFVADTSFRLYVGIKASGAFQHSSFLRGARISAAGLIKVRDGRLASLSPLSGHYRPPASNFRAFVHALEDEGADMSHVSISKSYAVLVGLEAYVKTRRKGKEAARALAHQKHRLLEPEETRRKEQAALDTSQSAATERRVLQKEERDRELRKKEGLHFWQRIAMGLGLGLWPGHAGRRRGAPHEENGERGGAAEGEVKTPGVAADGL